MHYKKGLYLDMKLDALVEFSNRYGANPALVLAGGGNTSMKESGILYVKGSGTALATITADGFVALDIAALHETLKKDYPADDKAREAAFLADVTAAKLPGQEKKRPSVEALLHSIFPQKYVLHLHPALVNGLTCSQNGEETAKTLFGPDVVWVPACRPGYVLGALMQKRMAQSEKAVDTVLLENHGVFFAADTVEGLDTLLRGMLEKLEKQVQQFPEIAGTVSDEALCAAVAEKMGRACACMSCGPTALAFSRSKEAAAPLLTPFTPDHIVYCGAFPIWADAAEAIVPTDAKNVIVILKDKGIFAVGDNEKAARNAMTVFEDACKIAVYARSFGGPKHMSEDLVEFILNWEAESYRKSKG
jgi:rhamnose utilization protein RhaD (predicted bifunctional aldolase and dehydrogenase)